MSSPKIFPRCSTQFCPGQVQIELKKVPFYQGAIDCVEMGIESSLQVSNVRLRRAVKSQEEAPCGASHMEPWGMSEKMDFMDLHGKK